jgi:hypothetical protein
MLIIMLKEPRNPQEHVAGATKEAGDEEGIRESENFWIQDRERGVHGNEK